MGLIQQGARTQRTRVRKDEQRRWSAPCGPNRVRSAFTQLVSLKSEQIFMKSGTYQ